MGRGNTAKPIFGGVIVTLWNTCRTLKNGAPNKLVKLRIMIFSKSATVVSNDRCGITALRVASGLASAIDGRQLSSHVLGFACQYSFVLAR